MLVVNFIHAHWGLPATLSHHNTYCSYADTIMPQFFFAVGLAYRWTFLRRAAAAGEAVAYRHALRRNLRLLALGVFVYGILSGAFLTQHFLDNTFQTLTTIAVTSLWVMPVMGRGPTTRAVFMVVSAALHLYLSYAFYFEYTQRHSIDGGPLGFLSWSIPLIGGTLACDFMQRRRTAPSIALNTLTGAMLMGVGYLLSSSGRFASALRGTLGETPLWAALPFTAPNGPVDMWTMNQQAGSVSYLLFAAGFSFCILAAWQILSDVGRLRVPAFQVFGQNALVAYLVQYPVAAIFWLLLPNGWSPWWYLVPTAIFLASMYSLMRLFARKGWYLRL